MLGTSGDFGNARYTLATQPAAFDASRGTVPTGDFSAQTDARTFNRTLALFLVDTIWLTPQWTATASARYNNARVSIRDRSGNNADLNGDHDFRRINPALGLTFNPGTTLTAYGSYSEGMRAPTAIELTCADPQAPCKLPNSFVADLRP